MVLGFPSNTLLSDGVLWRLQGVTTKTVDGHVRPTATGSWLVQVVQNDEAVLTETYPDPTSASTRANQLLEGLVRKGWVQIPIEQDGRSGLSVA